MAKLCLAWINCCCRVWIPPSPAGRRSSAEVPASLVSRLSKSALPRFLTCASAARFEPVGNRPPNMYTPRAHPRFSSPLPLYPLSYLNPSSNLPPTSPYTQTPHFHPASSPGQPYYSLPPNVYSPHVPTILPSFPYFLLFSPPKYLFPPPPPVPLFSSLPTPPL